MSAEALGECIYELAIDSITTAPKVPEGANVPVPHDTEQPAAAVVNEQCRRRKEPDFKEQCAEKASGGVRLLVYPTQLVQRSFGKRPLLNIILDIPVCADCFTKMTAREVLDNHGELWNNLAKEAQRRNRGILPDREQTTIEHVAFAHPEYAALRAQLDKHAPARAANDPQSGPSGPAT